MIFSPLKSPHQYLPRHQLHHHLPHHRVQNHILQGMKLFVDKMNISKLYIYRYDSLILRRERSTQRIGINRNGEVTNNQNEDVCRNEVARDVNHNLRTCQKTPIVNKEMATTLETKTPITLNRRKESTNEEMNSVISTNVRKNRSARKLEQILPVKSE